MNTTSWTDTELTTIGRAEELQLASIRSDGTLRSFVVMWVVRAGGDLYVRSAGGPDRPWFRAAVASGTGRIRAGGIERDVAFEPALPEAHPSIDVAYHQKYDRYGARIVGSVVGPHAHQATIRLIPVPDN